MCGAQCYMFDWLVCEYCISGGGGKPSFGLCNPPHGRLVNFRMVPLGLSLWWCNHDKFVCSLQNTEIGPCPKAFFTVTYSAAECSGANWLSCPGGRCTLVVDEVWDHTHTLSLSLSLSLALASLALSLSISLSLSLSLLSLSIFRLHVSG